jgi:starch synthase (maltosyl-transferring)
VTELLSPHPLARAQLPAPSAIAVEAVCPDVGHGRFPVKRVVGEDVVVSADVFAGPADAPAVTLEVQGPGDDAWTRRRMQSLGNDRFSAAFHLDRLGEGRFRVVATLDDGGSRTCHDATSPVWADRALAACSAWYEAFPRSASADPARAGNLRDVAERLVPYVAELGFDVLYLPPISPIGRTHRKGRDGSLDARPDDPGSPWAVGNEFGGHDAIAPELGTLDDFAALLDACRSHGVELALDLAFQCSPDHPWVTEHPEWFRHRPDGTIACAENPPKRYEDIYPFDFGCAAWHELWRALARVVDTWVDRGVRVFRVDNPHTKPFAFWEWLLARLRERQPEVVLLAEAFTRPAIMHHLAKIGFAQSYTYFTWRTTPSELASYFDELAEPGVREYFRPNAWPNTPDILVPPLEHGRAADFITRVVLAAGLCSNYGIYGPAFELQHNTPRDRASDEYLHSEKFEITHHDLDAPHSLRGLIARLNRARRTHPALRRDDGRHFHRCDNARILCWSKYDGRADRIVGVVATATAEPEAGWIALDPVPLGLPSSSTSIVDVHELLSGTTYEWRVGAGAANFVRLDPEVMPAYLLHLVVRPDETR